MRGGKVIQTGKTDEILSQVTDEEKNDNGVKTLL